MEMRTMAAGKAVTAAVWAKVEKLYPDKSQNLASVAALVGLTPIALSQIAKKRGWTMRTVARIAAGSPEESRNAQSKTLPRLPAGSPEGSRKAQSKIGLPPQRDFQVVAPGSTKESRKAQSKKPSALVQRVYDTIDGELTKLEEQTGVSSQDRERASRALSQMVSSLEKAVEMQREMTKATAKGSGTKNQEALAHAEDLRRSIAERLERLQRQRPIGKRSGASQ
jgi:predicted transcriptional regulator